MGRRPGASPASLDLDLNSRLCRCSAAAFSCGNSRSTGIGNTGKNGGSHSKRKEGSGVESDSWRRRAQKIVRIRQFRPPAGTRRLPAWVPAGPRIHIDWLAA
ncbi:uncharacterized protein LOC122047662 isoform X2 [Zingiber officinale]|uniref:uncharacterized protein LOC122047662 isoform X2 n=1 Tax=Zingiber officinale TaxID=94328 RepID=UPI001C4B2F95|nr:uncharacterized protein LOC122047662 isoform X2 [Zingiber officinale]